MKKLLLVFIFLQWVPTSVLLAQDLMAKLVSDTITINQMMDLSLEDLMQITVVTASKNGESKQQAPAVISVVTAREIEQYGAMSLSEVLDRVAGVFMSSTYFTPASLAIRGDHTGIYDTHVLLLVNGRPFRESIHTGINTSFYEAFPVSAIERVEIIKGPGSVLYGTAAYSGVINVITRQAQKKSIAGQVRYGSFGTWQGNVKAETLVKGISLMGAVNAMKSDGWDYTARDERAVIRNKSNTADSALQAPRTIPMQKKGLGTTLQASYKGLSLNGVFSTFTQHVMGRVPVWTTLLDVQNTRAFVDVGYSRQFSETYTSSLNLTYNHALLSTFSPLEEYQEKNILRKANDFLIEWSNSLHLSEQLNVIAGATAITQMGWSAQPELNPDLTSFDIRSGRNPNPYYQLPRYRQTWFSAYGQADYSPWPFVKLVGGGQVNKVEGIAANFVPRLGSIFTISPSWSAKVLYGQAFRSPSFFERGVLSPPAVVGNTALIPEIVTTFETQLAYTSKKVELSATYFRSRQEDLITRSNVKDSLYVVKYNGRLTSVPKYINDGELLFQGLELEGKANLNASISTTGSFTYQMSEDNDDKGDKVVYGMPKLMAKVGVAYTAPFGLSLGVFHSYFGKGDDITRYDEKGKALTKQVNPAAEAFHYLSTKISLDIYKLIKTEKAGSCQLTFYGINLLNANINYPELARKNINALPGRSGRALFAGVQFSF